MNTPKPEKRKPLEFEVNGEQVVIDLDALEPLVDEIVGQVEKKTSQVLHETFGGTDIYSNENAEPLSPDAVSD